MSTGRHRGSGLWQGGREAGPALPRRVLRGHDEGRVADSDTKIPVKSVAITL